MIKSFLIAIVVLCCSYTCTAQSGIGWLNGFITSSIKNGSEINNAMVVLTAIKNHSNFIRSDTVWTTNAYYKFEVSFGYYALSISAPGYKTYHTTVFIPSSSVLKWGTLLEKNEE